MLASTAVAFAGDWRVVLARFLASLVTAIFVGCIWLRMGKDSVIRMPRRARSDGSRLARFVDEVSHDVLHAGGAMRALYDDPENLEGKTFSLTGFASGLTDGEGWALTRMSLSCCAGDAQAIKVRVVGAPAPADNEWVTLTGRWKKAATPADAPETLPVIEASNLQRISAPANPYE